VITIPVATATRSGARRSMAVPSPGASRRPPADGEVAVFAERADHDEYGEDRRAEGRIRCTKRNAPGMNRTCARGLGTSVRKRYVQGKRRAWGRCAPVNAPSCPSPAGKFSESADLLRPSY
jgi:hypothetical protein